MLEYIKFSLILKTRFVFALKTPFTLAKYSNGTRFIGINCNFVFHSNKFICVKQNRFRKDLDVVRFGGFSWRFFSLYLFYSFVDFCIVVENADRTAAIHQHHRQSYK